MLIKAPSRSDLDQAYHAAGCPICALLSRSERRYIDATLYEHVTDVQWREEVRAARGFCALHTEHVLDIGRSALGVSLVAADILKTLQELLPTVGTGGSGGALGRLRSAMGGGGAGNPLRPQRPCPLCSYLADLGAVYVASLLDDLQGKPARTTYAASPGLCLPHLNAVIDRGGASLRFVLEHQATAWQRLEGELNEFTRKSDYQFSGEAMESERDAWRRALRLLSGQER